MSASDHRIQRASTVMVFNDMINANLRGHNVERSRQARESGIIDAAVRTAAELRKAGVPVFWIRVERRADGRDKPDVVTDVSIAAGPITRPPITKGSFESQLIEELAIAPEDQEVVKTRLSPFASTDLDLQLRARRVRTILLGGISTHMGVESAARDAFDLDYNVVVLSDCCWAQDHTVHDWALTRSLPNFARVMTSADAFALLS